MSGLYGRDAAYPSDLALHSEERSASLIAGFLYTRVSAAAPFYLSVATGLAAALLLGWVHTPQLVGQGLERGR
ncbi:MAG: hypothetical protein F6J97_18150 [Leptolyngbya sp. SIO4C1]|nr:hypothetical protein [Leptolyngbya sp. SIO4C1]